jgi:opacity protein-like surface antigen
MKTRAIKAGFAVSALALAVSPAMAAEIRIDGFANFAAGQMISDNDEGSMYGYDDDVRFNQESSYGIQFRGDLQEKLSITAQIVGKGDVEEYDAKVTWAYLSYELTDELTVKIGRSRVPYFMYSDFLDVGYAYHWLRPPESVYTLGFENQDGIVLEHLTDLMGWSSRLTVMGGRSDSSVVDDATGDTLDVSIRNQMGAAWSMNRDWFTARIAYFESRLLIPSDATGVLVDGVETFYNTALGFSIPGYSTASRDALLSTLSNDLNFDEDKASFAGIGFSVDYQNLIASAEYTMVRADETPLSDRNSWFVSTGYRIQKFTPYITYEKWDFNTQTDTIEAFERAAPATGIPLLDAGRDALLDGLELAFTSESKDAETIGVGVRYDFHPSAALKVEYNQQDNETTDQKPKVLAAAIQLVF